MQLEQCESTPRIVVAIRKRPINKKELAKGNNDIIDVENNQTIIVREMRTKVDLTKYVEEHVMNFDAAFDETINNEQMYLTIVRPIVEAAFNKAKVTCFAYGQTGSGKTYTMLGDSKVPGLYLLAAYDIFQLLQADMFQHLQATISFYEIYCGKLFDLLNDRQQLNAREDAKGNVNIVGLQERKINNVEQLMKVIEQGSSVRVTSSNSANNDSSRSHAILQISLKQNNKIHGKLSFIDLAGSERGADVSDYHKQTRVDGAEINKSLLALKECIRALDQNKNHTPFRGSKLTQVLKDSFVGNCKTVMIGTISPSSSCSEHSLNTLRYADRVKELRRPQQDDNQDMLARELMLPRQQQCQRYNIEIEPNKKIEKQQSIKNPLAWKNPPEDLFDWNRENQKPEQLNTIMGQQKNEEIKKISEQHENLINVILEEEENLISQHRLHIDQMVETVKQEMMLLHNVDRPGSDVDEYCKELDQLLLTKIEEIQKQRV